MSNVGSILNEDFPAEGKLKQQPSGDILIDGLSFSYPDGDEVLSDVSLKFKKNSVNAVIGYPAQVKLLLRIL